MSLDKHDLKIISLLDKNSRISISEISKKVNLKKDAIIYRIKKFEEKEIILNFYTIINTKILGFYTYRIYFSFNFFTSKLKGEIVNYLDTIFLAGQIFEMDGEYQIGAISWEKDPYSLEKKFRFFRKKFGKYISASNISFFSDFEQYSRGYFDNKKELMLENMENKEEIDILDMNILKELSINSRISSVELGFKLKIPQRTIFYRIKQLEKKKIISGYSININLDKIGYQNYFLELFIDDLINLNKIRKYISSHPNSIYSEFILGNNDLELEVEFQSKLDLYQFIEEIRILFPEIKKVNTRMTLRYYKIDFCPFISE
jgi:DNA-binding Lrp family transcriptional regulator